MIVYETLYSLAAPEALLSASLFVFNSQQFRQPVESQLFRGQYPVGQLGFPLLAGGDGGFTNAVEGGGGPDLANTLGRSGFLVVQKIFFILGF